MFKRLMNALCGASAEAGDKVMDTEFMQNAEIRGATDEMKSNLEKAKRNEAKLGGDLNTARRELKQLQEKYDLNAGAASKALDAGDEAKAIEFATAAEGVETEIKYKQQIVDNFTQALATQKKNIAKIKGNLDLVKQETKNLQAQKAVNEARKASQASTSVVNGDDADNALAVIRKRSANEQEKSDDLDYIDQQQDEADKHVSAAEYMQESAGSSLLEKLKAEKAAKEA